MWTVRSALSRSLGPGDHVGMSSDTMSPIRGAVRTFNRHVLNPVMLRAAGRKHWYASLIEHEGRCSGRRYATPVVADKVAGGFLVPLPYGTAVDWLRNTQAAGRATITSKGDTYEVAGPTIVDASTAAGLLPSGRRRVFQRFGIDHFAKFALASDIVAREQDR